MDMSVECRFAVGNGILAIRCRGRFAWWCAAWRGSLRLWRAMNTSPLSKLLPVRAIAAKRDRARAVLLTLAGWTSPEIAEAFGVREDPVRLWRSDLAAGGVAALKRSGASAEELSRLARCRALAASPGGRPPPRSRREGGGSSSCARGRAHQPFAAVQGLAKKISLAAAPAHAERTPDAKRDGACGPSPAPAQTAGRGGRHRSSVRRRERGADPSLSRPRLGEVWSGLARARAGPGQEGRDPRVA